MGILGIYKRQRGGINWDPVCRKNLFHLFDRIAYQVISAFGDTKEVPKQLEATLKAAKAGGASAFDSLNLLSAVTKGYGDTSFEAMMKVSDLAFQTVKLGQTTFPELASSIGRVAFLFLY